MKTYQIIIRDSFNLSGHFNNIEANDFDEAVIKAKKELELLSNSRLEKLRITSVYELYPLTTTSPK